LPLSTTHHCSDPNPSTCDGNCNRNKHWIKRWLIVFIGMIMVGGWIYEFWRGMRFHCPYVSIAGGIMTAAWMYAIIIFFIISNRSSHTPSSFNSYHPTTSGEYLNLFFLVTLISRIIQVRSIYILNDESDNINGDATIQIAVIGSMIVGNFFLLLIGMGGKHGDAAGRILTPDGVRYLRFFFFFLFLFLFLFPFQV